MKVWEQVSSEAQTAPESWSQGGEGLEEFEWPNQLQGEIECGTCTVQDGRALAGR